MIIRHAGGGHLRVALPRVRFDSAESVPAIARILLRSRAQKVLSLSQTIRKRASRPAGAFALKDRGRLTPGNVPDIDVFYPAAIADHATFAIPVPYATSVRTALLNTEIARENGEITAARAAGAVRGRAWTGPPGGRLPGQRPCRALGPLTAVSAAPGDRCFLLFFNEIEMLFFSEKKEAKDFGFLTPRTGRSRLQADTCGSFRYIVIGRRWLHDREIDTNLR